MTEGPYSNHLARFMREKGLTDPALARLLDISKQQIFNLRRGHRKLTVEWARRLSPHLGISWQELITGSPASATEPELAAILASYTAMDKRDRQTLARVAESMVNEEPTPPTLGAARRAKAPHSPLPSQIIDRPDELAWVSFWRGLNDAERVEALKKLRVSTREPVGT